jgi:putative flippase GtrA
MKWLPFIKNFVIPKVKFAVTSSIATAVDYGIYILLTSLFLTSESISHAISYTVGMIINFFLQKRFIFLLKRKLYHAFGLSVIFSLLGWLISQGLFNLMVLYTGFFQQNDILAKIIVTFVIFFYNFYTKRFSFEKKRLLDNYKEYFKK